jgi:hypothetical protein
LTFVLIFVIVYTERERKTDRPETGKKGKKMTNTEKKLYEIGGREWQKGSHHRIYFGNAKALKELIGLEVKYYKTGNVADAFLNGERISNSEARRILGTRGYYDVVAGEFKDFPYEIIMDLK